MFALLALSRAREPGPCASGDGLDASRVPLGPGAWRRGGPQGASPLVDPGPVANPHTRAVLKVSWWMRGRWSLVACPALPATGP